MPLPTNVHIDAPLSNIANAWPNREFLAPGLFPVVPVRLDSGLYWIWGKEGFEALDTRRAPGTEARIVDFSVSTGTYQTQGYALGEFVTDEERQNWQVAGFGPDEAATEHLTKLLHIDWERRVAALLFSTANWANSSPSTKWDADGSNPITDIETAKTALLYTDPNTIVMGELTWNAFKHNAAVLAMLGSNERGIVTEQIAAELTGIKNWKIGKSFYNTAKRGKTETMSALWGDGVWIGYIAGSPSPKELSAGYTFRDSAFQTQTEYRRAAHATWIETAYSQDECVTCGEAGYYLENVMT